MGIPESERVEHPSEYMAQLAQSFLPLETWSFEESYKSEKRIIYNSEWCRVKLFWSGWEMYGGNGISVYYGRLHAPDDEARMIWNGEECSCWHSLSGTGAVLDYLDGLTPQESAGREDFLRIIQQFRQSDTWQRLAGKRQGPELAVRMTAVIWDHYGLSLFELFDLRRPDLWKAYRAFLKEVVRIKDREREIDIGGPPMPPGWQIC
jgi:hypothetical protein